MTLTAAPGLQTPAEGIPLWVAKLKAERYAERTIQLYQYYARRYLRYDPTPTKLRIQAYLAERLERVSPAVVSNERKALVSLFSFLHSEGLWPTNPLNGIRHVRVSYRERLCPEIDDVTKALNSRCLRRKDTEKLRTLVLLLATTGLRISEATSRGWYPSCPRPPRHWPSTSRSGAKLEVVSRILGHAGVGVTADIYRHVTTAELHEEHIRFAPLNGTKALPEA